MALIFAALLAGLTLPLDARAQGKAKPKPTPAPAPAPATKPAAKPGKTKPADSLANDMEADKILRYAYIRLLEANHDYNGHRVKAMGQVKDAFKILDAHLLKKCNTKQKASIKKAQALIAQADVLARKTPTLHERQDISDAQLRLASEALVELRPMLVQQKQAKVVGHLDAALREIGIALKIR
jgi:hypothetical protein